MRCAQRTAGGGARARRSEMWFTGGWHPNTRWGLTKHFAAAAIALQKMNLECLGQCGQPNCSKVYRRVNLFENHVRGAPAAKRRLSERSIGAPTQPNPVPLSTGHSSAPESLPDGTGPFASCLDAAAHLLAALDSSEHLSIEATKRVVELLQPYALALVLATAQATGAALAPESWRSMVSDHFTSVAVLAKRRDPGSPLAHRLKALGYLDPSETHTRQHEDEDKCCYDVDLVADLQQMLQNDALAVQDVAASQARWRALATELTGTKGVLRHSAADVLTDVESGVLFRSRVLPVVDTLSPNELLMVGLTYMDDVDVTNDNGPSSGVHQQNMQYIMWLNLSPHIRQQERNIRLVSCCKTNLTKPEDKGNGGVGFPFVISDPTDVTNAHCSLGSQARRLSTGVDIDLRDVKGLESFTRVRVLFLFILGDNKGLNEVFNFSGSFAPNVWAYCRHCLDCKWAPEPDDFKNTTPGYNIWAKWINRLTPRDEVTDFMGSARTHAHHRSPALFEELQQDVCHMVHSSAPQAMIVKLLQVLGATGQIDPTTGKPAPHGYMGVPGLETYWDTTLPGDGMHDWAHGWSTFQAGVTITYCIDKHWFTAEQLTEATKAHYGALGTRSPGAFKPSHHTTTAYPDNACSAKCKEKGKGDHVCVPKTMVANDTKLPFHAADSLHWVLHSISIFMTMPKMREQLCKSFEAMDPAIRAWVMHVEVLGKVCAFRFKRDDLPGLGKAIVEAVKAFRAIPFFVLVLNKAKIHFVLHTVWYISLCGPMRYWWCFRMEGKHQPLKAIAVRSNFKNVSKSVVQGAMRQLAWSYSTLRGKPTIVCDGLQVEQSGLQASVVVPATTLALLYQLYPELARSYIRHWVRISTPHGSYQRSQALVLRGKQGTCLQLVCPSGVLEVLHMNGLTYHFLVLHLHPEVVSEEIYGCWSVKGDAKELVHQMMDQAEMRVLMLPLGQHHPDVELIPVHLTTAAHTYCPKVNIVPKHSGHV